MKFSVFAIAIFYSMAVLIHAQTPVPPPPSPSPPLGVKQFFCGTATSDMNIDYSAPDGQRLELTLQPTCETVRIHNSHFSHGIVFKEAAGNNVPAVLTEIVLENITVGSSPAVTFEGDLTLPQGSVTFRNITVLSSLPCGTANSCVKAVVLHEGHVLARLGYAATGLAFTEAALSSISSNGLPPTGVLHLRIIVFITGRIARDMQHLHVNSSSLLFSPAHQIDELNCGIVGSVRGEDIRQLLVSDCQLEVRPALTARVPVMHVRVVGVKFFNSSSPLPSSSSSSSSSSGCLLQIINNNCSIVFPRVDVLNGDAHAPLTLFDTSILAVTGIVTNITELAIKGNSMRVDTGLVQEGSFVKTSLAKLPSASVPGFSVSIAGTATPAVGENSFILDTIVERNTISLDSPCSSVIVEYEDATDPSSSARFSGALVVLFAWRARLAGVRQFLFHHNNALDASRAGLLLLPTTNNGLRALVALVLVNRGFTAGAEPSMATNIVVRDSSLVLSNVSAFSVVTAAFAIGSEAEASSGSFSSVIASGSMSVSSCRIDVAVTAASVALIVIARATRTITTTDANPAFTFSVSDSAITVRALRISRPSAYTQSKFKNLRTVVSALELPTGAAAVASIMLNRNNLTLDCAALNDSARVSIALFKAGVLANVSHIELAGGNAALSKIRAEGGTLRLALVDAVYWEGDALRGLFVRDSLLLVRDGATELDPSPDSKFDTIFFDAYGVVVQRATTLSTAVANEAPASTTTARLALMRARFAAMPVVAAITVQAVTVDVDWNFAAYSIFTTGSVMQITGLSISSEGPLAANVSLGDCALTARLAHGSRVAALTHLLSVNEAGSRSAARRGFELLPYLIGGVTINSSTVNCMGRDDASGFVSMRSAPHRTVLLSCPNGGTFFNPIEVSNSTVDHRHQSLISAVEVAVIWLKSYEENDSGLFSASLPTDVHLRGCTVRVVAQHAKTFFLPRFSSIHLFVISNTIPSSSHSSKVRDTAAVLGFPNNNGSSLAISSVSISDCLLEVDYGLPQGLLNAMAHLVVATAFFRGNLQPLRRQLSLTRNVILLGTDAFATTTWTNWNGVVASHLCIFSDSAAVSPAGITIGSSNSSSSSSSSMLSITHSQLVAKRRSPFTSEVHSLLHVGRYEFPGAGPVMVALRMEAPRVEIAHNHLRVESQQPTTTATIPSIIRSALDVFLVGGGTPFVNAGDPKVGQGFSKVLECAAYSSSSSSSSVSIDNNTLFLRADYSAIATVAALRDLTLKIGPEGGGDSSKQFRISNSTISVSRDRRSSSVQFNIISAVTLTTTDDAVVEPTRFVLSAEGNTATSLAHLQSGGVSSNALAAFAVFSPNLPSTAAALDITLRFADNQLRDLQPKHMLLTPYSPANAIAIAFTPVAPQSLPAPSSPSGAKKELSRLTVQLQNCHILLPGSAGVLALQSGLRIAGTFNLEMVSNSGRSSKSSNSVVQFFQPQFPIYSAQLKSDAQARAPLLNANATVFRFSVVCAPSSGVDRSLRQLLGVCLNDWGGAPVCAVETSRSCSFTNTTTKSRSFNSTLSASFNTSLSAAASRSQSLPRTESDEATDSKRATRSKTDPATATEHAESATRAPSRSLTEGLRTNVTRSLTATPAVPTAEPINETQVSLMTALSNNFQIAAVAAAAVVVPSPAIIALQRNHLTERIGLCGRDEGENSTVRLDTLSSPTQFKMGGQRRFEAAVGAVVMNAAIVAGFSVLYALCVFVAAVCFRCGASNEDEEDGDDDDAAAAAASEERAATRALLSAASTTTSAASGDFAPPPSAKDIRRRLVALQKRRLREEMLEDQKEEAEQRGGASPSAVGNNNSSSSSTAVAAAATGGGDAESAEKHAPCWYRRWIALARFTSCPGWGVNLGLIFSPVAAQCAAVILVHGWGNAPGYVLAAAIALGGGMSLYVIYQIFSLCRYLSSKGKLVDDLPWEENDAGAAAAAAGSLNISSSLKTLQKTTMAMVKKRQLEEDAAKQKKEEEQKQEAAAKKADEEEEDEKKKNRGKKANNKDAEDQEDEEEEEKQEREEEEEEEEEDEYTTAWDDIVYDEAHQAEDEFEDEAAALEQQALQFPDDPAELDDEGKRRLNCGQRLLVFLVGSKSFESSEMIDRFDAVIAYSSPWLLLVDALLSAAIGALSGATMLPLSIDTCLIISITSALLMLLFFVLLVVLAAPLLVPIEAASVVSISMIGTASATVAVVAVMKRRGEQYRQQQLERTGAADRASGASLKAADEASNMEQWSGPLSAAVGFIAMALTLMQLLVVFRSCLRSCRSQRARDVKDESERQALLELLRVENEDDLVRHPPLPAATAQQEDQEEGEQEAEGDEDHVAAAVIPRPRTNQHNNNMEDEEMTTKTNLNDFAEVEDEFSSFRRRGSSSSRRGGGRTPAALSSSTAAAAVSATSDSPVATTTTLNRYDEAIDEPLLGILPRTQARRSSAGRTSRYRLQREHEGEEYGFNGDNTVSDNSNSNSNRREGGVGEGSPRSVGGRASTRAMSSNNTLRVELSDI